MLLLLLLEMHKDIGGEGNGGRKESWAQLQLGHLCSHLLPSLPNLNFFLLTFVSLG